MEAILLPLYSFETAYPMRESFSVDQFAVSIIPEKFPLYDNIKFMLVGFGLIHIFTISFLKIDVARWVDGDFLSKKNVEDKKNEFFSIAEGNHKTRLNENIKINMNKIEETIKTFPNQDFFQEFPFLKKYLKNP